MLQLDLYPDCRGTGPLGRFCCGEAFVKRSPLKTKIKDAAKRAVLAEPGAAMETMNLLAYGKKTAPRKEPPEWVKKAARKRDKKDERFARQFHSKEFVEWIKDQPCSTCGKWSLLPDASHVRSRGAGGTWRDIIPQCWACHQEFHQKGRLSFCQARGWPPERLSELAAGYAREWEELQGATESSDREQQVAEP